MSDKKVRVAIIGVGNCASSLVQGVQFYKNAAATDRVPVIQDGRVCDAQAFAANGLNLLADLKLLLDLHEQAAHYRSLTAQLAHTRLYDLYPAGRYWCVVA